MRRYEKHDHVYDDNGLCFECDYGKPMHQVERDKRLKANNAKKGLRQVTVWVPDSKAAELKLLAQRWRSER